MVISSMWNRRNWLNFCRVLLFFIFALLASSAILAVGDNYLRQCRRDRVNAAINQDVWLQINEGMSRERVSDLIGGRSGNYNRYPIISMPETCGVWDIQIIRQFATETWSGDNGRIVVCFDENGFVRYTFFKLVFTDKRSLIERLLDRWR